jgi:dolichyl-phosphate-mannose-protein mannosyltransferase
MTLLASARLSASPRFTLFVFSSALFLALLAIAILPAATHPLGGDSPTYLAAIRVLDGAPGPPGFVPNRLMTAFGSLESIRFSRAIFGNVYAGWIILNCAFYVGTVLVFARLLLLLFEEESVAALGALFLAGNYDFLVFGVHYLVDIGGWMFFSIAMLFLARYAKGHLHRDLVCAFGSVALGAVFKEYALVALAPIWTFLLWETRFSLSLFIRRALPLSLLSFIPIALVHFWVFVRFGYTYVDWFAFNHQKYGYHHSLVAWIVNVLKCFGYAMNLLGPIALLGGYLFLKGEEVTSERLRVFVVALALSVLPLFAWPTITERLLGTAVLPFAVLAAIAIKKYARFHGVFLILALVYIAASYLMDAYLFHLAHVVFKGGAL